MGIKEGTNEKGMFPANFTKPLWELYSVCHLHSNAHQRQRILL